MLNRGGAHSFQQQAKQNRPRSQVKAPLSPRAPSWRYSGNQSFGGALNRGRKLLQTRASICFFLCSHCFLHCSRLGAAKVGLQEGEECEHSSTHRPSEKDASSDAAVLGLPEPGGEEDSPMKLSSVSPLRSFSGRIPAGSSLSPKRAMGGKSKISYCVSACVCVCVCMHVCVCSVVLDCGVGILGS